MRVALAHSRSSFDTLSLERDRRVGDAAALLGKGSNWILVLINADSKRPHPHPMEHCGSPVKVRIYGGQAIPGASVDTLTHWCRGSLNLSYGYFLSPRI